MLYKKPLIVKFQYGNKLLPNSRSNFNPNFIDPNTYLQDAQYQNSLLKDQKETNYVDHYQNLYKQNRELEKQNSDTGGAMAGKALNNLSSLGETAKAGSALGKAGSAAGKAVPWIALINAGKDMTKKGQADLGKDNIYGEGQGAKGVAQEGLNFFTPSNAWMAGIKRNKGNVGAQAESAIIEATMMGSMGRGLSKGAGKTDKTTGGWGWINKKTGITQNRANIDKGVAAMKAETDAENARLAEQRRLNSGRADEMYKFQSILNNANKGGLTFRKGGALKLTPKFRRGGELDVQKENIILDGPSHDEHNNTGVKNDKGLPVVKNGIKIAEIESKELVLNDKSSKEIESLVKQYNKSKDPELLKRIGKLMGKEINTNTYDYSKELIID